MGLGPDCPRAPDSPYWGPCAHSNFRPVTRVENAQPRLAHPKMFSLKLTHLKIKHSWDHTSVELEHLKPLHTLVLRLLPDHCPHPYQIPNLNLKKQRALST